MVNTSLSPEFSSKVAADGFGVNVQPENVDALTGALVDLIDDRSVMESMGQRARAVAQEQFNRRRSYLKIVELIEQLMR